MYGSQYHGSNYYASLYYAAKNGEQLDEFNRLSTRDVQYEALRLVSTRVTDSRTMEREYWYAKFGGNSNWSTLDIMYEGILKGQGYTSLKDFYDYETGKVWPDHNSSEKAYWLSIIAANV